MIRRKRRGVIVVLTAVLLVLLLALVAFAVDLGLICTARTQLQSAADAAALAGAADLPQGEGPAAAKSVEYVGLNSDARSLPWITNTAGQWDFQTRQFSAGTVPLDAHQVRLEAQNQSLFFGRALGTGTFDVTATATAMVRPRDMVLVLDFSGSMNSQKKVNQLKSAVELFFEVLDSLGKLDRVSFCKYSTFGELVIPLTNDFAAVNQEVQTSSANGWTNIYEGMKLGREQLQSNGRAKASKMLIIMTDGLANRPANRDPKASVLTEAQTSHDLGIDLYTISFGADADKTLMDQVAAIGNDVHFAVDSSAKENGKMLKDVFVTLANKRKVLLVQ